LRAAEPFCSVVDKVTIIEFSIALCLHKRSAVRSCRAVFYYAVFEYGTAERTYIDTPAFIPAEQFVMLYVSEFRIAVFAYVDTAA